MYRARGDYVRGYYRGDFLGIGHALKAGLKVIGGAVIGGLTGGLPGAIIGGAAAAGRAAGEGVNEVRRGPAPSTPPPPLGQTPSDLVHLHRYVQGKAAVTQPIGGSHAGTPHGGKMIAAPSGGGDGTGRGYHLDKKTKSYMVRNRSMNPYNPRALGRAERRVRRFVHMASHLIRWVHPHKTGRAVPKFGGRRKRAR